MSCKRQTSLCRCWILCRVAASLRSCCTHPPKKWVNSSGSYGKLSLLRAAQPAEAATEAALWLCLATLVSQLTVNCAPLRTSTPLSVSVSVSVCVCTWPCLQIHRERAATRTITSTRRTAERERERVKRASCLCYLHVSRSRPADKQSTQHTQSEGSERASTVREGRGERLETTWTRFARVFLTHNEKHCKRTALPDFT